MEWNVLHTKHYVCYNVPVECERPCLQLLFSTRVGPAEDDPPLYVTGSEKGGTLRKSQILVLKHL